MEDAVAMSSATSSPPARGTAYAIDILIRGFVPARQPNRPGAEGQFPIQPRATAHDRVDPRHDGQAKVAGRTGSGPNREPSKSARRASNDRGEPDADRDLRAHAVSRVTSRRQWIDPDS